MCQQPKRFSLPYCPGEQAAWKAGEPQHGDRDEKLRDEVEVCEHTDAMLAQREKNQT